MSNSNHSPSLLSYLQSSDPAISRYVIVANIYLSRSKQSVKIIDLQGNFIGIANRNEILDLFTGHRDHVNIVVYRCSQTPLEVKTAEPEKIQMGEA